MSSDNLSRNVFTLSLDAMGGDNAPYAVIAGASIFLKKNPSVNFIFCGDRAAINPIMAKFPNLKGKAKIIHCKEKISPEEKPSIAVRKGKNSSMRIAIDLVKEGEADAVISAGNTGALMAMSKIVFRALEGIDRPAICTIVPTKKGSSILLDMGANSDCDAENLTQFAIMGNAFAKAALNLEFPKIGLLNIGSEELKGHETVRVAHQIIQDEYKDLLQYCGYVEGDDITKGTVDVIVTDGFTGNIALKSMEGAAKLIAELVKDGFKSSFLTKIGFLLSAWSLKKLFKQIDPRNYNGAMFVGLNGISIKSHGNADKIAISNALKVAVNLIENKINQRIISELKKTNNHS
jgi:glycerol-3-phosphate acyltransferase PlsX